MRTPVSGRPTACGASTLTPLPPRAPAPIRSDKAWKYAFKQAGLTLFREELQTGFPEELFDVKMCVERARVRPLHDRG